MGQKRKKMGDRDLFYSPKWYSPSQDLIWPIIRNFRDRFAREKRNLESTVLSLQSSLELTQERVNKEEEYKGTTQAAQKQLMGEKRELLAKWVDDDKVFSVHSNLVLFVLKVDNAIHPSSKLTQLISLLYLSTG